MQFTYKCMFFVVTGFLSSSFAGIAIELPYSIKQKYHGNHDQQAIQSASQ